ncbi:hypothetical protein JHK86_016267 [Glycine max]|nr:hypothetical protein JHK86_016267 [Glycine max]
MPIMANLLGSPLLPSANQALLNISESGTLCDLENSMLASDKCKHIIDPGAETTSLSPASFMLLFIIDPACKFVSLHTKSQEDLKLEA